ncbi:MAG: serine protease [Verrucomicrobiia bacterium]
MKRILLLSLITLGFSSITFGQLTSNFQEDWLKAVVSIEVASSPSNSQPVGTGLLVSTASNHVVLVTAKHVVTERNGSIRNGLAYRLNKKSNPSYLLNDSEIMQSLGNWLLSTNADLAMRFISWTDHQSDFKTLPAQGVMLAQTNVQAGAPIAILGFPMGLRSEEHSVPILRKGAIARSDPENLIADCFVFPGNSGGPVIYVPAVSFAGDLFHNPLHNTQKWLGIVSSEISYVERAYSSQTLHERAIFEENSGLCNVVPTERIQELMESDGFKAIDAIR